MDDESPKAAPDDQHDEAQEPEKGLSDEALGEEIETEDTSVGLDDLPI